MVTQQHSQQEVLSVLQGAEVGAVATASGESLRNRMMHFAVDESFTIYLATMKGDPKTVQMTRQPAISILVHRSETDINNSKEVEVTGRAVFVTDSQERERALEITAQKSPVVKYLTSTGNAQVLDCLKVVPEVIKYRIFGEIVQGLPPTVIDFPQNRMVVSDWSRLKNKAEHWYTEVRPAFLTAAALPVLLGTVIAWALTGAISWVYFLLALLAGVLLQAGTNVMNDYFDHRSGNDEANQEFVRPFSGGSRLIQLGLLSPVEVLTEGLFLFAAGTLLGIYLALTRGPFIFALGAIAILSGFFYTGRPFNWASRGLGEIMVGLNFGPLMVLGAYYVQTQQLSWLPVLAGLPLGFLIAAVLYINEFPDYNADKKVGKKTWVVRLGKERAVWGYGVIMAAVYISLLIGVLVGKLPPVTLIMALTLPLAIRAIQLARRYYANSFDLAPANALTITGHLLVGLLLTLAYIWEGLGKDGLVYVVAFGLVSAAFTAYMYWHIERQMRIFHGLKASVSSGKS